ncbi:MAG: hypothetical protein WD036_08760 [Bauldia sp.]
MTSKFASLHADLLARKGEAAPVFSDPAVSYVDAPRPLQASDAAEVRRDVASADGLRLIAEKIMMDPPAATRVSAETGRPPHLRAVGSPAPRKPIRKDANGEHQGPYRFTFRISPDQRRRLRVAAAQKGCSLQQSLGEALDKYLDGLCACSLKDCACLARRDGDHRI